MRLPPPKPVKEAFEKFAANHPKLYGVVWLLGFALMFCSYFFKDEMTDTGRGAVAHIFTAISQPVTINAGLFAVMLLATVLKVFGALFALFKKAPPAPSREEVLSEIATLESELKIRKITQEPSPMVEASLNHDQKELLKEFSLRSNIEWDTSSNSLGWFAPRFLQAMHELNQRNLVGEIRSVIPRDEMKNPGLQGMITESIQRSLNKKVTASLTETGKAAAKRLGFIC